MENLKGLGEQALFQKGILYLCGTISAEHAKNIAKILTIYEAEEREKVSLHIDTLGGDWLASVDILVRLMRSPLNIEGVVERQARSGGALILQGCKVRTLYQFGVVHLHHPTLGLGKMPLDMFYPGKIENTLDEIRKQAASETAQFNEVLEILSGRIGKSVEEVRSLFGKENIGIEYSDKEAMHAGLIDKIL